MMIFLTLVVSVACVVDKSYGQDSLVALSYYRTAISYFEEIDKDDNRQISLAEFEDRFRSKYDDNGDGEVSRYEFTKYFCKSSPSLFKLSLYLFDEYNSNGGNKLDTGDFSALFDTIDTTGDGAIRRREFINYLNEALQKYEDNGPVEEKNFERPSACQ